MRLPSDQCRRRRGDRRDIRVRSLTRGLDSRNSARRKRAVPIRALTHSSGSIRHIQADTRPESIGLAVFPRLHEKRRQLVGAPARTTAIEINQGHHAIIAKMSIVLGRVTVAGTPIEASVCEGCDAVAGRYTCGPLVLQRSPSSYDLCAISLLIRRHRARQDSIQVRACSGYTLWYASALDMPAECTMVHPSQRGT